MSFAAMAGWQALLLVAAVGAAAAWLFLRKVRPPRVDVPSLLLWQRVFDHSRALTWWERVRRAVSLAATVLAAAMLALAVARPIPRVRATAHGRLLIVIDSSTSMRARTADGRSRWQHAVAIARRLAASAGGDVSLATTADGLVEGPTSDTALVETALDRLEPVGGGDVPWPRASEGDTVHFITDGARARPIDSAIVVHSVFEPAPNVAVTALAVRPATTAAGGGEAYLEVANYADVAQPVRISLTRGTETLFDQSVSMNAGEAVRQVVPLAAAGDPRLRASAAAAHDALAEDNQAVAWIGAAQSIAVTLVTDQPAPFAAVLQRAANVTTTLATPATYRPGREDVVIFDRWLPAAAPGKPALVVAPPAATWLGQARAVENTPRWTASTAHAVLAGIDPLTVDIKRAMSYAGDGIDPIAKSDQGTPLVAVVDRADRRFVILTFGLADSNLPLAPAFPVFVGNALEWLARPVSGEPRAPGLVTLAASTAAVSGPDGRAVAVSRAGSAAYARLVAPGFYDVQAGGSHETIAVNAGEPDISNLTQSTLSGAARAAGGDVPSGRPWWLYLAVGVLTLVTVEWVTWNRRLTV